MAVSRTGAFLLGLEGLALLRGAVEGAEAGTVDRRLDEIKKIVGACALGGQPLWDVHNSEPIGTEAGYAIWASTYDTANPLIDVEEPVVRRLLADCRPGVAVDVCCGTGRHGAWLAERGHRVVGIDSSPEMLVRAPLSARARGRAATLPLAGASVDLIVCSLALTHMDDLERPFAEFARVLRPGGVLVTSDIHFLSLYLGGVAHVPLPDGSMGRMPASVLTAADYIKAATANHLVVEACEEPRWPNLEPGHGGPNAQEWCPEAARAAYVGVPAAMVWRFGRRPVRG
jgi:SAM-dependent methyltransferase